VTWGRTGTTDCTVVPWTGTRMRYAGLESRPGVGLRDIKVGGHVGSSLQSSHVRSQRPTAPSDLGTCMHMHCRTIRRDETRWQRT
jgi:hypothetical protein